MTDISGIDRRPDHRQLSSDLQLRLSADSPADIAESIVNPDHLHERVDYALRRRRDQRGIFPPAAIHESCWDIMLMCLLGQLEGRQLCVKQIRNQLDESSTALLRRLAELEEAAMIERHRDAVDGRRTMVRLTKRGLAAMARFFAQPLPSKA